VIDECVISGFCGRWDKFKSTNHNEESNYKRRAQRLIERIAERNFGQCSRRFDLRFYHFSSSFESPLSPFDDLLILFLICVLISLSPYQSVHTHPINQDQSSTSLRSLCTVQITPFLVLVQITLEQTLSESFFSGFVVHLILASQANSLVL
jgi:hypothetical protein